MNESIQNPMDRRSFLKLTTLVGGGFALGLSTPVFDLLAAEEGATAASFVLTPYVQILPDGKITIFSKTSEIGQGIKTTLTMLIAEELEVDFNQITVEQAPINSRVYGEQGAMGSSSVRKNHELMRRAGATAREMLIAAAAQIWSVPSSECKAEQGKITHSSSNHTATYAELASKAATLPVPDEKTIKLKSPKDFKIIGQWTSGVDNRKIVTGKPLFGLDVQLPGMLYALFVKCPVHGGSPVKANLEEIKNLPGVKDAFIISNKVQSNGVAIVADNTWAAMSARKALQVEWSEGAGKDHSWEGYTKAATELGPKSGAKVTKSKGNFDEAFNNATKKLEAFYSYPFIAHVTMETPNCTVHINNDKMDVWIGTQTPNKAAEEASDRSGIKPENVTIHLMRAGGGFGRRLGNNYLSEAIAIALKVKAPIKLIWDRTDDIRGGSYRSANFQYLRGGIDSQGKVTAWSDHFIHFSTTKGNSPAPAAGNLRDNEFPSDRVPHFKVEETLIPTHLITGIWRQPGQGAYTFVLQSFLDELAFLAEKDPLQFRIDLLGNHRFVQALKEIAEKAEWGKPLPKGQGRGVSFGGDSVQVAKVAVDPDGTLTVEKITVVALTPRIINPSGARSQIEGSILDGLSATWFQSLNIEKGAVVESNFTDYPLLRINQAPKVDVHVISSEEFTGMGEPYLPATAAAVTNAIFAATGHRVRHLPIRANDLKWS